MKIGADCIHCMVAKQLDLIAPQKDEALKTAYLREVLCTIADSPETSSAPQIIAEISLVQQRFFGQPISFDPQKRLYNRLLLDREEELARHINAAPDPLQAAVKLARSGNYIDFGALNQVSVELLDDLLEQSFVEEVNKEIYQALRNDLEHATTLAYLTDNCGEIVLDKLLIRTLRGLYPGLEITVVTRGAPILNDATVQDAREVGLPLLARVIGNGTSVAGTSLELLTEPAKSAVTSADLLIAKGQGNYETLSGCGLNIYYLFLCKCDYFARRFALERFQGVFLRERSQIAVY